MTEAALPPVSPALPAGRLCVRPSVPALTGRPVRPLAPIRFAPDAGFGEP
jgi:hypothetical protein